MSAPPRWRLIAAVVSAVLLTVLLTMEQTRAPAVVLLAVPVVLLAQASAAGRSASRPDAQLRAWARQNGWGYDRLDRSLVRRWRGRPFDVGSEHIAHEVVAGVVQQRSVVSCTVQWLGAHRNTRERPGLDWLGTRRAGRRVGRHQVHLVAIELPARLPDLALRPHRDDGIREMLGEDVDTESAAFNATWRVQGSDRRTVHGVLNPVAMERLMLPDVIDAQVRTEGAWLLLWWPGPTDLVRLDERIAAGSDLARLIPRHVWQDHGYDLTTPGPTEEQL